MATKEWRRCNSIIKYKLYRPGANGLGTQRTRGVAVQGTKRQSIHRSTSTRRRAGVRSRQGRMELTEIRCHDTDPAETRPAATVGTSGGSSEQRNAISAAYSAAILMGIVLLAPVVHLVAAAVTQTETHVEKKNPST